LPVVTRSTYGELTAPVAGWLAKFKVWVCYMKFPIDATGIERPTANAYDALLERLLITERIPAWSSNRLNRLIRLPKRYLVDPAFAGPLLGVDARAVLRDGDLLGRLLDSFVMAQLRAECTVSELSPHLFHVRDANGRHEVDMLVELGLVLHTGPRSFRLDEAITALPICALWGWKPYSSNWTRASCSASGPSRARYRLCSASRS
jgi:hypothetical protein